MNNTAVLSRLYEMANNLRGEDKEVYAACREAGGISSAAAAIIYGNDLGKNGMILAEFIQQIEKEISEKNYSHGGKTKTLSAAKRVLKSAGTANAGLQGVIEHDGKFMVCDGYRLIVFNDDLPLPRAEQTTMGNSLAEILKQTHNNMRPVNIAKDCENVRNFIIEEKAKRKGDKSIADKRILFDIPNTNIRVNAQYLIDMMDALPGCSIFPAHENEHISPIYFEAENGCGVLLPVNH